MEYMKVAIVTDDRAYAEAVSRSLLIGNRGFELSLFSCGGFTARWREGGIDFRESFDLILWDSEIIEKVYGGNIVWLTERRSRSGPDVQGRFAIYKYSPSAEMVGAVFRVYAALTGRRPAGDRPDRVDIFAFVSWQGGSGCTTLAMALGQELARFYRRRVLYLSLEAVESTGLYMQVPEGMRSAGELLYHLSADGPEKGAGDPPGIPFLEEYLIRDSWGVEAIAPGTGCNPLAQPRPGELGAMLSALMRSGRFDVILIDAGTGTGTGVREGLAFADRICLVSARAETAREAGYRAFLRYGIGEEGAERLLRIYNRYAPASGDRPAGQDPGSFGGRMADPSGAGSAAGFLIPGSGRISGSASAGAPRQAEVCVAERDSSGQPLLLEGRFGKDIHNLAEVCYN